MKKAELLRAFDSLMGLLVAHDNNSIRSSINEEGAKAIEEIRGLILNMPEEKEDD